MWLFLIFIAVPLIEIALFVQIGGLIGLLPTLAIVLITAILGTALIRQQGIMALGRLRQSLSELDDPTEPLAHGAMILFSGAMLLTPGFFTDAFGFALLVPPVRVAIYKFLRNKIHITHIQTGPQHHHQTQKPDTIEAEYHEVKPDIAERPGNSGWTKH